MMTGYKGAVGVCTVVGEASISRVALSRNACSVSSFLTIDRLINRIKPTQKAFYRFYIFLRVRDLDARTNMIANLGNRTASVCELDNGAWSKGG
jgi:hypothetical protein